MGSVERVRYLSNDIAVGAPVSATASAKARGCGSRRGHSATRMSAIIQPLLISLQRSLDRPQTLRITAPTHAPHDHLRSSCQCCVRNKRLDSTSRILAHLRSLLPDIHHATRSSLSATRHISTACNTRVSFLRDLL